MELAHTQVRCCRSPPAFDGRVGSEVGEEGTSERRNERASERASAFTYLRLHSHLVLRTLVFKSPNTKLVIYYGAFTLSVTMKI